MITKEPKFINHIGQNFGKITVLKFSEVQEGKVYWLCRCECGTKVLAKMSDLMNEIVTGCDRCVERRSLYSRWDQLVKRCTDSNHPAFADYGGRGITVCEEWEDFEKFFDWAFASGYSNELQIDRRNNNRGYSPENCRWVTRSENLSNKRNNVWIEIGGKSQIVARWSKEYGISPNVLSRRIARGWEGSDLLLPPGSKRNNLIN